jgi:flagellum-specific peptidoglycan hydrolase FlgJ
MQPTPDVVAAAQAAARKWGVPASVTLAQWADESGWGQHMPPGSNNPFGMKAPLNKAGVPLTPFVDSATTEVEHGVVVHIEAPFRKFVSLDEAFDAHAELLATAPVYAPAMRVKIDPVAFSRALVGRYATDPDYAKKLLAIMRGSDLYQYDVPPTATAA